MYTYLSSTFMLQLLNKIDKQAMKNCYLTRDNTTQPLILEQMQRNSFIRHPVENVELSLIVSQLQGSAALSKTEQELQSSALINHILNSCRLKVVHHKVRSFSKKQKLYHKYSKKPTQVSELQSQPCSKNTVQSIFTEISESLEEEKKGRKSFSYGKTPIEDREEKGYSKNRIISMSGLISYNFRSIKSRNRLAIDPSGAEEEMENQITGAKQRSIASLARQQKIRLKSEGNQASQHSSKVIAKAIKEDKGEVDTSSYLKKVLKDKRSSKIIYGRQSKEYDSLKQMSREVSDIQEAVFMIEEIKRIAIQDHPKQSKATTKPKVEKSIRQLKVFQSRKGPQSKNKICVSNGFAVQRL